MTKIPSDIIFKYIHITDWEHMKKSSIYLIISFILFASGISAGMGKDKCPSLQSKAEKLTNELSKIQSEMAENEARIATDKNVEAKFKKKLTKITGELEALSVDFKKNKCLKVGETKKDWCYFALYDDKAGCYDEGCVQYTEKEFISDDGITINPNGLESDCECGKSPADIMKESEKEDGGESKIFLEKKDGDKLISINFKARFYGKDVYYHFSKTKSECNTFRKRSYKKIKELVDEKKAKANSESKKKYGDYE